MYRMNKKSADVSVSLVIETARHTVGRYLGLTEQLGLDEFFRCFDTLIDLDLSGAYSGWSSLLDKLSIDANNHAIMKQLNYTLNAKFFSPGDIITVPYHYIAAINLSSVFRNIELLSDVLNHNIDALTQCLSKNFTMLGVNHYPQHETGMWAFDWLMSSGVTLLFLAGMVSTLTALLSHSDEDNRYCYFGGALLLATVKMVVDLNKLSSTKHLRDRLVDARDCLLPGIQWNHMSHLSEHELPRLQPINTNNVLGLFNRGRQLALEPAKPEDPNEVIRRFRSPVRHG